MAITTKSAFWNDNLSLISERNLLDPAIGRALNRPGMRKVKELFLELIGVAPGAAALATHAQVQASTTENGGKRTIETVTDINRATTAADVTQLLAIVNNNMTGSYVASRSLRA